MIISILGGFVQSLCICSLELTIQTKLESDVGLTSICTEEQDRDQKKTTQKGEFGM